MVPDRARPAFVLALLGVAALTTLHLLAPHHHPAQTHHLLRRLYYLPILTATWAYGLRGGLGVSLLTVLAYAPHAFGFGVHGDPSSTVDKVAEMVLFIVIGGGAGSLLDRERRIAAELRASLERLEATQAQLLAAEEQASLGLLTAGLAHEVRNPLSAIRGSAEILRDAHATGDRHRRIAELLVTETERLDGVVGRFLALAQGQVTDPSPVSLTATVEEAMALARGEADSRGVRLDLVLRPVVVLGDAGLCRQVLLNLLLNGIQVQGAGGRVLVELLTVGDFAVLRVDDAGPGIAREDQIAVFRPFWSRRTGGTGLGLSIARRIAAVQGGTLTVTDSPLGGARFELRLPLGSPAGGPQ